MVLNSLYSAISGGFLKLTTAKEFSLIQSLPKEFNQDDSCICLTVHKSFSYQGKKYNTGEIVLHWLDSQMIQHFNY